MQGALRREEKNLPDLEGNYEVVRNVSMAVFEAVATPSGEAPAIFPRGRYWPKAVIREQSLSAKIAQLQKPSTATSSLKSPILQKLQSPIKIEPFHLYRDQSQTFF